LEDTIVNELGSRLGDQNDPRTFKMQAIRVCALSRQMGHFYIRAEKQSVGQLREIVLDTIAWAEYIQLTEDYIPKLTKEMKTYLDEQKERVSDADYKHFMGLLFDETEFVEDMRRNPKQWVQNRKNDLKKTIKYPNRKSIEPTLNSFKSLKPRIFPENVLQAQEPECLVKNSGTYAIRSGIVAMRNKYSR